MSEVKKHGCRQPEQGGFIVESRAWANEDSGPGAIILFLGMVPWVLDFQRSQ